MARIGNWEWIVDSDEIHWSEEVYRIFGLDSKRFEPDFAKYVSLIHPEDREMVVEAVNNALSRGGGYGVEHRILLENGEVRHIQGIGAVALDKEGRPVRMAGTVQDVTDKVLREEVLREREEMLRAMSNAAHDAMIMIDAEDTVYFWNKAAESMFGYSSEEAMGAKMHELITLDEDRTRANVGLAKFGETGRGPVLDSVMEFTAVRKNGETFPVERSVAAFQLGEEWYAVGSLRDITRRKRDEARLKELATTDGLTGLNNRRHFMELAGMHLEQAGRYSKPFSLITLDVDYFKSVNDTYGHDAGDRVLTTLSRLCEDACRKVDVVGRLGGEEFAVAMPETGPEEARRAAERLRRVMAEAEVDVRGGKIGFTVSLGVASLSPEIESLEQLLKSADEALYRAKQGGRNRVETDE
jgi:diguanylate cyclase (GGDEF)-like protein/PAS domain S-box-containing protein